jgi:DNA ligase-1
MRRLLLLLCCCLLCGAKKPDMLLAETYQGQVQVNEYWISEKLDGVRAYWTGSQLLSRGGHVIIAPAWFVADFPARPLDGELWLARGQFAKTMSIVSKTTPVDAEWQQLRYCIFELPYAPGTFTARLQAMQNLLAIHPSRFLQMIPQFRLPDTHALHDKLRELEQQGAEGLMLHHQDAHYKTGRSHDLLKLKSYQDTEAEVIGYRAGQGKYRGMVGALVVKNADGKTFALGSGLTDDLRRHPPPRGSLVTYRYNGLTKTGLPRFARFIRIRQDIVPEP